MPVLKRIDACVKADECLCKSEQMQGYKGINAKEKAPFPYILWEKGAFVLLLSVVSNVNRGHI
jgi:hypothetical protein